MNYIKLTTSDGEMRWINLARVSRVTLANQTSGGKPLLVIIFHDSAPDARITISGTDSKNLDAIKAITDRLDALAASD